jgi:hypothetical protein
MKYYIFAGLAVVLIAGVIGSAPQANAGCQYGGIALSRCDGPIQPDGTWQRCALFNSVNGGSSNYLMPNKRCDQMGPDLRPWASPSTTHRRTSMIELIPFGKGSR